MHQFTSNGALVGLLIAQSLLNETRGHIVYVCPTNQLVEQTIQKATECGLSLSSRYDNEWSGRSRFDAGDAVCITNYATLFNGLSVFRDVSVDGVVFDDAHVAENIIRSQFTIRIGNDTDLFRKILALYRPHFANSCLASQYEDASNGSWEALVFVPMFIARRHAQELRKLLIDSNIVSDRRNKYPWAHLKNKVDICCVFVSGSGVQITPSFIPLHTLSYFGEHVRRVYLTATIPTQASFIRTFGASSPKTVSPKGKSGDAQRLFVFSLGDDDEQKDHVLELIGDRKACIISPSKKRAEEWVPPATVYDTDEGHSGIETFCRSDKPVVLALVARYDGVDLPGKACRILVLDRVPMGHDLFEKFADQVIQVRTLRSSHAAIRITQAIGRIFRSNTDHGIVIIRGSELQSWLSTPKNRALLPALLQKQVQLGLSLRDQVKNGKTCYDELMKALLQGERDWDKLYRNYIDEYQADAVQTDTDWYHTLLTQERNAHKQLWDGQYAKAAKEFHDLAQTASEHDHRLRAWYLHWAGLSYQQVGADEKALVCFHEAAGIRSELGRPSEIRDKLFVKQKGIRAGTQAVKLAELYGKKRQRVRTILTEMTGNLCYGPDTAKAEEAAKNLGIVLGLEASRPDSAGTGPDVLWMGNGEYDGAAFELKTNKKADGRYSKDDIKDCHDHNGWLASKHDSKRFLQMLVGRELRAGPARTFR